MRTDNTLHNGQGATWQLLLQFVADEGPAGERETVQRVAEALRGLGRPSPQMDRIGETLVQALRQAARRGRQGQPALRVTVRVWVSDGHKRKRSRFSTEGKEGARHAPGGWGFFVIQKREENPQAGALGAHHLIELYLYQEGEYARKEGQT